ncbi:hypothetical protein YC2023_083997 [Brassica napus]
MRRAIFTSKCTGAIEVNYDGWSTIQITSNMSTRKWCEEKASVEIGFASEHLVVTEGPLRSGEGRVGKRSSTVEMCGKVYRLAPVTLTEKEQMVHQRRMSRAYQWKRTNANHPFETTVSDIDQELAQNNVYQKQGVPFRIRAEHEANTT